MGNYLGHQQIRPDSNMSSTKTVLTLAATLFTAAASHAATITFETAADFDSNFWAPKANAGIIWSSSNKRIERSIGSGADLLI
jgi:hypothetical protein